MRLLWFCVILQVVTAQAGFGRSYMGNSRLCREWSCFNKKLNLTDSLPPKEHYGLILKNRFPESWQTVVDSALEVCYGKRSRKYTNTCPGQAIMFCVMDQAVMNCPINSLTTDSCTPLSSLAGYNYMFSQSRYENLEQNLKLDRRPPAFLRNYYHTTCCDVPDIFEEDMLKECGFERFVHYNVHGVQQKEANIEFHTTSPITSTSGISNEFIHDENLNEVAADESEDPLDCCDVSGFIEPSWKSECGFQLKWDVKNRLTILNSDVPTSTASTLRDMDIKVVPITCENQQCIFDRLGITKSGEVDVDKFVKLLDNMTNREPLWNRAKERVLASCLRKPLIGYESDCEINSILGCTLDVLSENCPHETREDQCKNSTNSKEGVICHISSSKYGPKNRRQFCNIPNLVRRDILDACGVSSIFKIEYVLPQSVDHSWGPGVNCKESTVSTNCLMNKMGVLNKYGFIDYFKMKDKMRSYSERLAASIYDLYTSSFINTPYYKDHCSSPKKLLNVIDSILLTCPTQNRKKTKKCDKIFTEMKNMITDKIARDKIDEILNHSKNYYLPTNYIAKDSAQKTKLTPLYDFGILSSNNIPPVKVIDVTPKFLLYPVHTTINSSTLFSLHNDGVFRG
nr:uncharacterized protein LOC116769378 isoform X1 [Danaus plexippus plexippus]